MTKIWKTIISASLGALIAATPLAGFAQTSDGAQSTGDRENAKERSEMDNTRKNERAPTDGSGDASTGPTSGSGAYAPGDEAPSPNAKENEPRPSK